MNNKDNTNDKANILPQKDQNVAETTIFAEDNLELKKMKFSQRMQAKKARLKANTADMTSFEKLKYYFYYYKWSVLIGILVLFCAIAIPIMIYKNSRPISISYAVVNSTDTYAINADLFLEYARYYNIEDGYQIRNSLNIKLSHEGYENRGNNDTNYVQFPLLCQNNYFDIILTDATGLDYCSSTGLIYPIKDRLFDDMYIAIEANHPDVFVFSPNYNNELELYAIDISKTEFAKKLNLGYDDVYVCFPGSSNENIVNIRRFLNYVLELNLEI